MSYKHNAVKKSVITYKVILIFQNEYMCVYNMVVKTASVVFFFKYKAVIVNVIISKFSNNSYKTMTKRIIFVHSMKNIFARKRKMYIYTETVQQNKW